jgi:hypothetical protein
VFAAGIGAIFFTEVYFGENGHIPSLSATKFIFANNKALYDGSYIAALKKMSHLIPNNETLLTTAEAPQTGYFSGYHDVFATGPNELNSTKLMLDFMIQRNITYLVAPEGSIILSDLKSNFKELGIFTTDYFKIHLFERIYDSSFISALKKMLHLVPNNETLLVSHDTQRIMHLSGHNNIMSVEPAAIISKEALVKSMEKKKLHYFISFEFKYPGVYKLFNSKGQRGLKTDLKELDSFTTDNFKMHLYKRIKD